MAHFAKLNESNIVIQVIVVANEELLENGMELETKGIEFCKSLFGGNWKQTSYNGNSRKQYAGIGHTYDVVNDVFISPKPFASWALDSNFDWQPPTPQPVEGRWNWNEETLSWIEVDI
jgi:hypothetical protein